MHLALKLTTDSWLAEDPHYLGEIILLKQANCGDAGSPGGEARASVRKGNSAEGEDQKSGLASLPQHLQACRTGSNGVFLFENWREDSKSRGVSRSLGHFGRGVAGHRYKRFFGSSFAGKGARATLSPDRSDFLRGNIVRAQVDAVGLDGQRHVST